MFDVDRFKKINDTYGHQAGDVVLKTIADIVAGLIRTPDVFARWGGEEFMILAPHTDINSAVQLSEKLRMSIEEHDFGALPVITCSFGITELQENDTVSDFTERVDRALYDAKGQGRNRGCVR